jgi:hypothetical protein
MNAPHEPVTITEITDLTAWLRRLSDAGPGATDERELAAFHTAKTTLLARIHNQHTPTAAPTTARPDSGKDTR